MAEPAKHTYTLSLPPSRQPTFAGSLEDGTLSSTPVLNSQNVEPTPTPFGGKLLWVGNATCIIEVDGLRFMTDPNFLHQGNS